MSLRGLDIFARCKCCEALCCLLLQDGITLAKCVMRHMPLGCDRNHDRYWFFPAAAPGLYIEKGRLLCFASRTYLACFYPQLYTVSGGTLTFTHLLTTCNLVLIGLNSAGYWTRHLLQDSICVGWHFSH